MSYKIKFIEEMAVINCQRCPKCWGNCCNADCPFKHADSCNSYRAAEKYYDLGYRKEKDTAKEILQYLYEKMGNSVLSDTDLVKALAYQYGVELG